MIGHRAGRNGLEHTTEYMTGGCTVIDEVEGKNRCDDRYPPGAWRGFGLRPPPCPVYDDRFVVLWPPFTSSRLPCRVLPLLL
jgi:hypothetical protein